MRPQVPNLNQLISTGNDAQVLHTELEVFVSVLTPVDDGGYGVAASHLSGVDLRQTPEYVPL